MTRPLLARLIAVFLTLITSHAGAASPQSRHGRSEEIEIPAPSLANNLVGTATVQAAAIYVPPSYATAKARRYPVIYLLHGIFDDHRVWERYTGISAMLDRLIEAKRLPEVIVVMPDGGNRYGGGYYRNSPVTGNWQDFIARDLIGFVDRNYRTIPTASARAAIGWSMGGYGALHLAMERPGLISIVYAMSPCCLAPVEDLGFGNDAWRRVVALKSPEDVAQAGARKDWYAVAGIGLLAAFDPAPNAPPLYVRMPVTYDGQGAVLDRVAVDRLAAQFPLRRLDAKAGPLRALKALGLDYGIDDNYAHIPPTTSLLSSQLAQLAVPHRFEVYRGNHRNRIARRLETIVLPFVGAALEQDLRVLQ